MGADVPNPAFQRDIPHGTVIIDLLLKVVFFGSFRGTISDLIWGPYRTSFWTENKPAETRSQTRKLQFALKCELGNSNLASRARQCELDP